MRTKRNNGIKYFSVFVIETFYHCVWGYFNEAGMFFFGGGRGGGGVRQRNQYY